MNRVFKSSLVVAVLLVITGLLIPLIMKARVNSDRIGCQNHLRELGLNGVRHAMAPGAALPMMPKPELPAGTFVNPTLTAEQRMSWYIYTVGVLDQGLPTASPQSKQLRPRGLGDALKNIDVKASWNDGPNAELARFRLTTAICPAQIPNFADYEFMPNHYIAVGGLGLETPALSLENAGKAAGAYRYDSPTPDSAIRDGLQQTAQIIETTRDLGPWLQGGPSTLRGLDVADTPYLGRGRPFGGCHPNGAYVAMADGSVPFVRETISPPVLRAMFTIAGGPSEESFDTP